MNTFKVLCVYDMTLVLLKLNGKMLVKNSSGAIVHICMSSLRRQTSAMRAIYVTLVNKTARLLHSYRDAQNMQDSYLNRLLRCNIYKY